MDHQPFTIIKNYRRKNRSRKSSVSTTIQKEVKEFIHKEQIRSRKLTHGVIPQNIIQQQMIQDDRGVKSQGFKQDDIDQYFSFYDNKNYDHWIQQQNFYMEKIEQQPIKQKQEHQKINQNAQTPSIECQCNLQFQQFKPQDFLIIPFSD